MGKWHYDESSDSLIHHVRYDPTETIENNAALRSSAPVTVGSKGQQMVLAASIPLEHVTALKNLGYNLMSSDPSERRRALVYLQSEQPVFLTTEKQMFAKHRNKWQ